VRDGSAWRSFGDSTVTLQVESRDKDHRVLRQRRTVDADGKRTVESNLTTDVGTSEFQYDSKTGHVTGQSFLMTESSLLPDLVFTKTSFVSQTFDDYDEADQVRRSTRQTDELDTNGQSFQRTVDQNTFSYNPRGQTEESVDLKTTYLLN